MALQHVPGKNMGDLKLFALSTCPWCRKTKQLLDELGVKYDFVDVDLLPANEKNTVMTTVRKWNPAGSFPVLVINDKKTIVGFREAEIREALKNGQ
jgi:glutaredoxin-like protein NrdH